MSLHTIRDEKTGRAYGFAAIDMQTVNEAVYNVGKEDGYSAGYEEKSSEISQVFYKAEVIGQGYNDTATDGETEKNYSVLEIDCPFYPDLITITCDDFATVEQDAYAIGSVDINTKSNGVVCGNALVLNQGKSAAGNNFTKKLNFYISKTETGYKVGRIVVGSAESPCQFVSGMKYFVVATKL